MMLAPAYILHPHDMAVVLSFLVAPLLGLILGWFASGQQKCVRKSFGIVIILYYFACGGLFVGIAFFRSDPTFVGRLLLRFLLVTCGLAMGFAFVLLGFAARNQGLQDSEGVCQECAYDLTGNISGVCPECGAKVQRETRAGGAMRIPKDEHAEGQRRPGERGECG